ncbi:flagellar basal body-associated protein FliL [Gottschalkia acidurici 9a]|uniref:Flagellar protein FliL n=1 Tax=Gottschalkia acidurici (strain ATCC 7906 / DSM 604 / BCRC 14475 / CIP 104303 / KCTC 5404 / NCIMB 10678 / 9a) TaxID=1128398 RepID=K0AZA3_GOTA9|nr:flagellar basal body-associated FliL family protein [Gottschalkia acidurici]AFS78599.1 flagellar basal body-associated protein FliL [Gottschalkia acidurici 9a]
MSTKKIIIIGVFVLLAIVAIIFGAIFGLQMSKNSATSGMESAMINKDIFKYDVGEMYCNLSESRKLVKINITVETANEKFLEILENKNYIIRHEINEIIRSKKEDELSGSEGQKAIQKEILGRLNEVFNTKLISDVYFNDFIVQ